MNHTIVIILGVTVVLTMALLFTVHRLLKARITAEQKRTDHMAGVMQKALSIGDYYVIDLDLHTMHYTNVSGDFLPPEGMSAEEFDQRFHPDDLRKMHEEMGAQVGGSGKPQEYYGRRWNTGPIDQPHYDYFSGCAVVETDKQGVPRHVVTTLFYVTHEIEKEREDRRLSSKYQKLFDTTLTAMAFFNAEGRLIDMNSRMAQIFGSTEGARRVFGMTGLFGIPTLKGDLHPGQHEDLFSCHHMTVPPLGIDIYAETRVCPFFEEGQLKFYTLTIRDITAERQMYLDMKRQDDTLRQAAARVSQYERELRYLLENCNMYVWQIDLASKTVTFARSLETTDFTMSHEEYIDSMFEDEQQHALATFGAMLQEGGNFAAVHHFRHTPVDPQPSWYTLSGLPVRDKEGRLTGYFGLARNITELMEAQEKLRKETARADASGKQKAAFLANMTHELRTPLNAIVGFSEILPSIDDAGEKQNIIQIIRTNCDMQLRLVNDILEASNLSANALEIHPVDVDFAREFDLVCQTLAGRVTEPGVNFLTDNPYATFPTRLDPDRIRQVLTNFVTNAVKYTHQGYIKVGYSRKDNGLYIYCEDTGAGIPKEKQASVFDRFVKLNEFVQGTGLGLSICKAIAQRQGGEVGVISEGEGCGTIFWMWIPLPSVSGTD